MTREEKRQRRQSNTKTGEDKRISEKKCEEKRREEQIKSEKIRERGGNHGRKSRQEKIREGIRGNK